MGEIGMNFKRVDDAVHVLILAGMSTPNLREAAEHGVDVTRAGHCRASLLVLATLFGCVSELRSHQLLRLLDFALSGCFLAVLISVSADRRCFAAASCVKVSFAGILGIGAALLGSHCDLQD